MKNKYLPIILIFLFSSCDLVGDLLNTSYSTTFKESFDINIPEGEYTEPSPFLINRQEDIDLTDDSFPSEIRAGVSELLDIQFKEVLLTFSGELVTDGARISQDAGIISGKILFANPDKPSQTIEIIVPSVSSADENAVSLPLPDNVANSITQLFLENPRVTFSMDFKYVGPAPFEGKVDMEIPMEVSIGVI